MILKEALLLWLTNIKVASLKRMHVALGVWGL